MKNIKTKHTQQKDPSPTQWVLVENMLLFVYPLQQLVGEPICGVGGGARQGILA